MLRYVVVVCGAIVSAVVCVEIIIIVSIIIVVGNDCLLRSVVSCS